jgi:hypothetical protein
MKILIIITLQLFLLLNLEAQCFDVYNNKTECPTMADSLTLYNNALKVINFYETNPNYERTSSEKIEGAYDKLKVFQDLVDARRMFRVIRQAIPFNNKNFKDFTFKEYYQEVDDYRFYQRELENQLLHRDALASLYDFRISPVLVNKYANINKNDIYYGDLVNIPLYAPVVVKPFMLLTDSELVVRNAFLNIPNTPRPIVIISTVPIPPPSAPIEKHVKIIPSTIAEIKPKTKYNTYSPVYYFEDPALGGPALVGFMNYKTFVRIRPEDYTYFAVPKWAQNFLKDMNRVEKYVKLIFGDYCEKVE